MVCEPMGYVERQGCLGHRREGWKRALCLQGHSQKGQGTVSLLPQNIDQAAPGQPLGKAELFKAKQ